MSNAPEYGQGAGTLKRAATLVSDARADFTTISGRLTDQIAAVQGKWGGAGASAFFTLHQAWTEKQGVIVKALDDFSNSLGVTENINTDNDQTQGSNFGRLTSKLGG